MKIVKMKIKSAEENRSLQDPNRLFPLNNRARCIAQSLYKEVKNLAIISPHGHCNPKWFSENKRFPDPAQLFVVPDHYILRMLVSHGFTLNELGVQSHDDSTFENDPQKYGKSSVKIIICFEGRLQQCGLIIPLKKSLE